MLQLVGLDVGGIAHRLILSRLHIIVLHGETVCDDLFFRQAMTEVKFAPQLVDAETQSGSHGRRCPVLVEIVVVVESGRQCGRDLLTQHRTPLCRDVTVLIAVIVIRTERELVMAPVAIYLQTVPAVGLPRQHAA